MGQQCAREQRQNGNVVQTTAESSLRQMIGLTSESVIFRQSIYHSDLEEISIRVPPYALLPFMAIFRDKCKLERRNVFVPSGEKSGSKHNKKSWKRVTLTDTSLHSMFPCIHTEHIGSLIRYTIRCCADMGDITANVSAQRNQQVLHAQIDNLVLVDQTRLSAAFHIASHLCKPENIQNIGYKQELLFQDFSVALAICLHGTREEMLIFLFLLFADVSLPVVVTPIPVQTHPEVPAPKTKESVRFGLGPFVSRDEKKDAQHAATRKRSYTDPHHGVKSHSSVAVHNANHNAAQHSDSGDGVSSNSKNISAGHAAASRTRHASFDQTIGTAEARQASAGEPPSAFSLKAMAASLSTVGAGNGVKYSNNSLSDSSLLGHAKDKERRSSRGDATPVDSPHEGETRRFANPLLSSLGLSEGAVYRLLLFFHLARKHSSYIPLLGGEEREAEEEGNVFSAANETAHLEAVLDLVGRISSAPASVGGSVGGGVSFDSFMSLLHPPVGDGISYITSGVGSLLLARTLRGADHTGAGPSDESLRRVLYVFANDLVQNPYQMLKHCRDFFRSNTEQKALHRSLQLVEDDVLVQKVLPDYQVFLLDAQWWRAWCAAMEVRAVYASSVEGGALSFLVTDVIPDVVPGDAQTTFKYQRVSAFESDPALRALPPLRNSRLVSRNALGVYTLWSIDAIADVMYVALPFDLGRALYAQYDKQARSIPAEVYRRRLNFCSSAVAQQDTPRGQIASSVNNFITNFYATNCAFLELQPRVLPVYFCTASGLAASSFSDVLTVRSSSATFTILNEGVRAVLTAGDFLSMHLRRVLGDKGGLEAAGQSRLWVLYRSDKTRQQVELSADRHVLCHGVDTEWRLLEDRSVDLLSASCMEVLGLMIEGLSADNLWPSDKVAPLAYCVPSLSSASVSGKIKVALTNGAAHSTIVTSESPNEEDLRGQCSAPNSARGARNGSDLNSLSTISGGRSELYCIGQLVDVLADSGCFHPGEVISIAREQRVDHSLAMLVTLRLADPVPAASDIEAADTVILPYYSPRILPRGAVTGLFSIRASGSTLGAALVLVPSLIDVADSFARSQNMLAADKSLRVSRTVLHKKFKTAHRPRVSEAVVNPLMSSPALKAAERKNLKDKKGPRNSADSVASVSSDEEDEDEEESVEKGDVPRGLSTVESQSSLASKQSSTNGTIHSASIVVENGATTPQKGAGSSSSKFFSPGKGASSSTVIPLPFEAANGEGSAVTVECGPSEEVILSPEQPLPQTEVSPPKTAATSALTAATTEEELDEEVEEVTAPPSATVSVDLSQLFRVIARSEKDGLNAPPALRLLYDIVSNEHSLVANKSSTVNSINVVRTVFATPTAAFPTLSGLGLVASSACEDDDQIVVRNMDTNRSLTESGHSTDTAGTEAGSNSSGLMGSKRRRLHLKSISKACSSLSRLLSVQHRTSLSSSGRGAAGEVRSSTVELAAVGTAHASPTASRLSKATGGNVVVTSGGGGMLIASTGGGVVTTVGLTGLNNLGNTCFLSSALQCLTRTPLFVLYFLTQQYKADLNLANALGSKGKLSEEFGRFLSTVYNLNGSAAGGVVEVVGGMFGGGKSHKSVKSSGGVVKYDSMSPTALLRAFQAHKPYFTGADQQDAQEFLAELLDTFHEDLKMKRPVPPANTSAPATISPSTVPADATLEKMKEKEKEVMSMERILRQGDEAWQQYVSGNSSVVSSVFQGQLCNKVTCKVCQTVSVRFEPFTTLSLSIPKLKNGPNSTGSSDSVTVIATVYRKMPRLFLLKQLRALTEEQREGEKEEEGSEAVKDMGWDVLLAYMAMCSKPTRVAVSMNRQSTVHDIKARVIEAVNSLEGNGQTGSEDSAADQEWSLASLPPLTQLHTTAIDVNGEERGRIKKILESRETLSSLVDDFQTDYQILVLENNKHIPYISSLPATRLVPSTPKSPRQAAAAVDPSRDWRSLCQSYSDELEYSPLHGLYNNDPAREGRLLADLDHAYSKDSFAQFHPTKHSSGNVKHASLATAKQDDASVETAVPPNLFDNSLNWPATLDQFRVGDRVDALDHKGSWFSGSVLDVYFFTEEDVQAGSLAKHTRETAKETPGGRNARSQTAPPSGNTKTRLTPGIHVRVHFDNFSTIWDEWYDQRDYERGFIFPVYSKAQRKLKIFDLQVVQRRLLPSADSPPQSPRIGSGNASQAVPPTNEEDDSSSTASGVCLDVFDVPIVVQSESYRSLAHVYKHIVEQMTRFMTPDEVSALVRSQQTGDEAQGLDLPFTLRLLSSNNLFAPPVDGDSLSLVAEGSEGGGGGRESFHRFYDFRNWEGAEMPRDVTRPVVNLFHSRLIIAVDWFRGAEVAAESAPALKRSLSPVDNESYSKYVALVYQKQQLALLAQQQTAVAQPVSVADPQRFKDTRVGLTIEHLLSKFVGLEQLDEYYCETCKKLCPALMHSSLHRLPDVLILHLKRLVMNATGGGKIRTLVKFPLLDLDMGPYATESMTSDPPLVSDDGGEAPAVDTTQQSSPETASEPAAVAVEEASSNVTATKPVAVKQQQQQQLYDLYGVVNHLGGMYGGHYTAYANCEQISLPPPGTAIVAPPVSVPLAQSKKVNHATEDEDDDSPLYPPHSPSVAAMEPLSLQEYVSGGGAGGAAGPNKKKWLKFDDEFVLEVTAAHGSGGHLDTSLVTESAYLLFYQRRTLSPANLQKYL